METNDKIEFLKKCKDRKFVDDIIDNFHKLYYYSSSFKGTWKDTYWMGIPIQKNPLDCWVYQELIHNIRPDFIIETGTKVGGSSLYFANICDNINHGQVITIDISDKEKVPVHGRIKYLIGNFIDDKFVSYIKNAVSGKKVMVILDSNHSKEHVLKELEMYSKLVSIGSYIIVEDSNICNNPVYGTELKEGPFEAIKEFLENNTNFVIDYSCEKFYFTFSPSGFLTRIK